MPSPIQLSRFALFGLLAASWSACSGKESPDKQSEPPTASPVPPSPVTVTKNADSSSTEDSPKAPPPSVDTAAKENAKEQATEAEAPKTPPHPGPWLWVTRSSAAIYTEPSPHRKNKLGYVKRGGQVPILEGKVDGKKCSKGWFKVASGGYICSHVGTTNKNDRGAKFRPSQPAIEEILPYKYARNAKNGTPAYRSLPTQKQTHRYEPYLPAAKKERDALAKEREEDRRQMEEAGLAMGGAKGSDNENEIPLWEREEKLNEVTLEDLRKDRDEVLASRMMKGFYIAIDKTFKWDKRTWYKTTKGLITPADRFYQTAGSDFHGVEIDGEDVTLPIGWVFGGRKSAPTYEIDTETNKRKAKGSIKKFSAVPLQYIYHRIGKIDYFQMKDGDWIRDRHIRMTTPGKRPEEVGPHERWIDVDISEQTLVVFEGDRPVYATLISSGKHSRNKEKDHSTPRGMWRIREKHIASTMDGDGSAAGDLPYSIEDVPYIMYFHKSYATHGAFWHRNYGVQMSHGCVNMAPLDAKWVFFYADPQLPAGFHGNWSSKENQGSMVVVHD